MKHTLMQNYNSKRIKKKNLAGVVVVVVYFLQYISYKNFFDYWWGGADKQKMQADLLLQHFDFRGNYSPWAEYTKLWK